MTWKLWLDDQVNDPEAPARHCPAGHMAAESFYQAQDLVLKHGPPDHVDLDHDLGLGYPDGMDFLKWLYQEYPDNPPKTWRIHSANPVGAEDMRSYLDSWDRASKME